MRTSKDRFNIRKQRQRTSVKRKGHMRLSVFKSNRYFYAQLIDDAQGKTVLASSSIEKDFRQKDKSNINIQVAEKIGDAIGKKIKKAKIEKVVLDRGGYKYHGVVKAFADAVRKNVDF